MACSAASTLATSMRSATGAIPGTMYRACGSCSSSRGRYTHVYALSTRDSIRPKACRRVPETLPRHHWSCSSGRLGRYSQTDLKDADFSFRARAAVVRGRFTELWSCHVVVVKFSLISRCYYVVDSQSFLDVLCLASGPYFEHVRAISTAVGKRERAAVSERKPVDRAPPLPS